MSNIFLTGGNGFIGKNFVTYCNPSHHIFSPSRSELELTHSENVNRYFEKNRFDYIINAASTVVTRNKELNPSEVIETNLRTFSSVFKHRHSVSRFIQLGSGAEYGRPLLKPQIKETELENYIPQDAYGFSKFLCSRLISNELPDKAVTLNLFGVFGPHEDYEVRFISNTIIRALLKQPLLIIQNVEFDYVYIKDLINILEWFMTRSPCYSHYNITTGIPITLLEIAEIIRDVTGNREEIIVKNSGMGNFYTGNNERLRAFLGTDFSFTPIKTAIEELAIWYESNMATLNKEKINSFC